MTQPRRPFWTLCLAALLLAGSAAAQVPERWRASFDAFDAADRASSPAPGGVVFVGSSSIRLWDGLESGFAHAAGGDTAIVKRGFGGSLMSDCREHAARLVVPYRPRLVVVYAGDNDLSEGRSPVQVRDDFAGFVQTVHAKLPDTRIAFVSIKPSPRRIGLLPQVRQANELVAAFAAATPKLAYIDVFTPMLDPAGKPRAELYGSDALHLSAAGYALWHELIAPHLALPAADALAAR